MSRSLGMHCSCIHLVVSSVSSSRGLQTEKECLSGSFCISLFIFAQCHIPRPRQHRTVLTVYSWLIKHAAQPVALIDISEPPSNLLYLYLLVFRASEVFRPAWAVVDTVYSLVTLVAFSFGNPVLRWLFVLHYALMIETYRGGIILVNFPSKRRFTPLASEQEMEMFGRQMNGWACRLLHRCSTAFLITTGLNALQTTCWGFWESLRATGLPVNNKQIPEWRLTWFASDMVRRRVILRFLTT